MLEVIELTKDFGGLRALNGVSFFMSRGEILGFIGPNGAGKTTLFNLISGIYRPSSGSIRFNGIEIVGMKPHEICQHGLSRTFQIPMPFPKLNVLENVSIGAFSHFRDPKATFNKATEILERVGLGGKRDLLPGALTISELKRLEIARSLATGPTLLLLDEVIAGMNAAEQNEMILLIRELKSWGISLVIIEHVMKVIMTLSDRIVVLHHGEKIAEGNPKDVSENPKVIQAYLGEKSGLPRSQ